MTSLSKNGYKIKKDSISLNEIKQIKDDLNVKPFNFNKQMPQKKFQIYLESPNSLYLPKFYGLTNYGEPNKNNEKNGKDIKIKFNGDLRQEQKPIEELYLKSAKTIGGGIISLQCGGGKTVLALHIASVLKKKTLVVLHKDFLMTQWADRIRQFLPEANIGKIQQNTIDIEDKEICLAMIQSISMKEYNPKVFEDFGLVIFDECHHTGAEVFSKCLPKVASKYMLGLSATPDRKDGLSKVFEWYIGPIVFKTEKKNEDYVEVQLIPIEFDDEKYNKIETTFKGDACMPRMINNICNYKPRTKIILDIIKTQSKLNRKILILSDRREHLNYMLEYINKHICPCGLYVGGMKPNELRESQEKDCILGTFSMASEGMDIPKLNTIILASPKSDVIQSVGRIFREKACEREFHPLVYDIQDNFSLFSKQNDKRIAFYKKNNFTIFLNGEIYKKKRKSKKKEFYEINECLID